MFCKTSPPFLLRPSSCFSPGRRGAKRFYDSRSGQRHVFRTLNVFLSIIFMFLCSWMLRKMVLPLVSTKSHMAEHLSPLQRHLFFTTPLPFSRPAWNEALLRRKKRAEAYFSMGLNGLQDGGVLPLVSRKTAQVKHLICKSLGFPCLLLLRTTVQSYFYKVLHP